MPEIRANFGSFPQAVDYFRRKITLPSERWDDLWQGQHARSFVVAGATRDALLADLREAVDAAISKGETLADFRKRFDAIVAKHGWTGWTGEGTEAGRAWRAAVIYHTNIRVAYMAGRWEQLKEFPYLKYQHNTVKNPREAHKAWDGLIIDRNDPWWQVHYPPNGWGCRCTVTGVSKARLIAEGRKTPDDPPPRIKGDPPPEWAYNVGEAAQAQSSPPAAQPAPLPAPAPTPAPSRATSPAAAPASPTPATPAPRAPAQIVTPGDWSTAGRPPRVPLDPVPARVDPAPLAPITIAQRAGDLPYAVALDPARVSEVSRSAALFQSAIDAIRNPAEIFIAFVREATGRIRLRTRFVRGFVTIEGTSAYAVADAEAGQLVGVSIFDAATINAQRIGMLAWARGRGELQPLAAVRPDHWKP